MWVGQLGWDLVGIFNGLFQVTAVTQGIDLFIYIVSALVLLISETQVLSYRLNNEERAAASSTAAGSSNVGVQLIGFPGVFPPGLPPHTFKFLAVPQLLIIVLFSVFILGIIFLISSYEFITQPAPFDPIFIETKHAATIVTGIKGKGFIIYDAQNRYDVQSTYYYFRYSESN